MHSSCAGMRRPFSAGLSLLKLRSAGDLHRGLRHFPRNLALGSTARRGGAPACGPARSLRFSAAAIFSFCSLLMPASPLTWHSRVWLFSAEPWLPRRVAGTQGMTRWGCWGKGKAVHAENSGEGRWRESTGILMFPGGAPHAEKRCVEDSSWVPFSSPGQDCESRRTWASRGPSTGQRGSNALHSPPSDLPTAVRSSWQRNAIAWLLDKPDCLVLIPAASSPLPGLSESLFGCTWRWFDSSLSCIAFILLQVHVQLS